MVTRPEAKGKAREIVLLEQVDEVVDRDSETSAKELFIINILLGSVQACCEGH